MVNFAGPLFGLLLAFVLIMESAFGASLESVDVKDRDRTNTSAKERWFALVRFQQEVCEINPAMIGTCTTGTECTNRGGSNIGSCAKGLGVCCLLTITATPQNPYITVRDRAVVLEGGSGVTQSTFEFPKFDGSCQLLVEFLEFALQAPVVATGLCLESMRISGSVTVDNGFTICGPNIGQKIYLSYGRGERITLEFNTPNAGRYRMRVRHIMCRNTAQLAPVNCLQNYLTSTGIVKSFSYGNSMIAGQHYTVCIQEASGSRSIEWLECTAAENGVVAGLRSQFFLSNYFLPITAVTTPTPTNPVVLMGITGHPCVATSYVEVFGEAKHCGAKFTINTANGQTPVISQAKPFQLYVRTTVNNYIAPPGSIVMYSPTFAYPIAATTVPAPVPACAMLGGGTTGAQGFGICTETVNAGTCTCMAAAAGNVVDPSNPARTGFCLKYTLM